MNSVMINGIFHYSLGSNNNSYFQKHFFIVGILCHLHSGPMCQLIGLFTFFWLFGQFQFNFLSPFFQSRKHSWIREKSANSQLSLIVGIATFDLICFCIFQSDTNCLSLRYIELTVGHYVLIKVSLLVYEYIIMFLKKTFS